MGGAAGACARCKESFPVERLGRVPWPIKIAAALALALAHGGLWAYEELSRPYCPRCRLVMLGVATLACALGAIAGGVGIAIWMTGPGR